MRYINAIVKILTFPGGFLKGFWEQILCRIYKTPVENRKYFQFNEMAGHIEHEPFATKEKSFWFCFISGIILFFTGLFFAAPAAVGLSLLYTSGFLKVLSIICLYVGLSMLTNIFPSIEDGLMMWENYKNMNIVKKIIFAPGAIIMYIGAYAESFGITFLTNVGLAALLLFL